MYGATGGGVRRRRAKINVVTKRIAATAARSAIRIQPRLLMPPGLELLEDVTGVSAMFNVVVWPRKTVTLLKYVAYPESLTSTLWMPIGSVRS